MSCTTPCDIRNSKVQLPVASVLSAPLRTIGPRGQGPVRDS
ncbi:hypothetical protein BN2537_14781 [Streptomyces venezuelae]|nr:hypothetical protein BN2537_14781 [Streptomyces venezuelae]